MMTTSRERDKEKEKRGRDRYRERERRALYSPVAGYPVTAQGRFSPVSDCPGTRLTCPRPPGC